MKTRVAFLIRRLVRGGAERQLIELARGLDKERFDVTIMTFYEGGAFESEITPESGIRLICLHKGGRWDVWAFLRRLIRTVRELKPHIVHGYLGVANELSVVAGRACGARVVWGLRAADFNLVPQTLGTRCLFYSGALASHQADRIIVNSERGRTFYAAGGYCEKRLTVIPNGIDTDRFAILPEQRRALRQDWSVGDDELLIGRAARFDRLKDYPTFLKAAALVIRAMPNVKVACIGDDTDCPELREIAAAEGIASRVIWASGRADMPAVYNALDISVSSSVAEGFPNAIAESMSCGTPCVATDAGDSALMVGDTGIIVPIRDPEAVAGGILQMINGRAQYARERVRQRITDNFSTARLIARTEAEFGELLRSA